MFVITADYIRHHLAPISGSISRHDPDPVTAAWRELTEETSLTPSSAELWRKGIPFTFSDPSAGREWTVHPFAFRLKNPSEGGEGEQAIKIDWEHDEWQWHDPDTIVDDEALGGVPRLRESLRRVWFEGEMSPSAAKALAMGLDRLRNDHESGARELTAIALGIFRDVVGQMRDGLDEKWWEMIRMAAWHLWKNGRESMGAGILNAVLTVLTETEKLTVLDLSADTKQERVLAMLDHRLNIRKSMAAKIKGSLVDYIQSQFLGPGRTKETLTILTLSASSTIRDSVVDVFASLDIETLELRILESRPLFEGVSIASSIYSNFKAKFHSSDRKNLKISIYTDASAALASAGVDILILGADRISSTRGVSNKTGSLPAVLSARHVSPNVKVLVISETEKVKEPCVGENDAEENNPAEIANTWSSDGVKGNQFIKESTSSSGNAGTQGNVSVEVKNIYFEWVPLSLVDGLVCEEGILGKDGIRERSEQLGEEIERFFGSL
ncbi:hypothetical protein PHISCL_02195 [Aspergillus sclerotialis]|uniref:Nudix hydrolase domain-containing protein n=1 Tax=Aspergillus sclerotialis TaxID=2070753 RepID=A0A3A2ZQK7_9EURO|nr:hypothetical protein PHISCL_02195 [Aspergillus sclerotialis]